MRQQQHNNQSNLKNDVVAPNSGALAGCAGFSVGLNRLSRALLHEIYGIATPLVLTDQEGNELEDERNVSRTCANLTELNVFDDVFGRR
jgi:hypothetical protein